MWLDFFLFKCKSSKITGMSLLQAICWAFFFCIRNTDVGYWPHTLTFTITCVDHSCEHVYVRMLSSVLMIQTNSPSKAICRHGSRMKYLSKLLYKFPDEMEKDFLSSFSCGNDQGLEEVEGKTVSDMKFRLRARWTAG